MKESQVHESTAVMNVQVTILARTSQNAAVLILSHLSDAMMVFEVGYLKECKLDGCRYR